MIRRIVDFYRLQIHVMRTWRPSGGSRVRRILVTLVMSVVAFALAVLLTPGITIDGDYGFWTTAVVAAVFLGILNVAVRPLFIAVFASVSVIAVFAATLIFQIASFFVLPFFVGGLHVSGLVAALIGSLIYAFILTILTAIFSVSQDDSYWSLLVQQLASRDPNVVRTDQPGLVVVQVDGLPHDVLSRQVRAGRVPHMSRWLRSEKYRLSMWDALLPPTTPASQAGILHGNNDGIPAFRWYEKDSGTIMVANHPDDALVIGQRISDGEGLLSNGGASVGNLFSGDAARSYMTMATIKDKSQGLGKSQTFFSFFASPTNYLHTLVLFVAEIGKEYVQARRQERAGIVPRMHRGMPYPVARAATNVALRNLSTALVIEEMYRGASTIYVDYTDYDEIAHHSGPERPESLDALDGVDQALATLEKASAQAPRPYRFVVVSDHGQSLGATFLQLVVLAKLAKCEFHGEVRPGDTLRYRTEIVQAKEGGASVNVVAHIGERCQANAEIFFARLDPEAALAVARRDRVIDEEYEALQRQCMTFMMEDPRAIRRTLDVVWVARALERIGDHAKNICEYVIYMVLGKDVRHVALDDVEKQITEARVARSGTGTGA